MNEATVDLMQAGPLPDEMTFGECYKPAMMAETREEAANWLRLLVERHVRVSGVSVDEARRVELLNIGYWSGYYEDETRQRVYRLYETVHPIFGRI